MYINQLIKIYNSVYKIYNSVYKPVNQNIDNIIEKHVVSIKNDFNINIKEVDKISLSYIGYPNNIKILTNLDSLLVQPTVPQKLYQFNYLWPLS